MSMTATARRVGDSLKHEVDVNGRHTIVTDEPERLGGTDHGPAPHELLAATLASCVATMIAMYAQNRGWDIGETAVDVDYDPDSVPRRFAIDVHLPDDLTPDQRRRLERVAETCPVRRALETGFTFEERMVATPAPTAAAEAHPWSAARSDCRPFSIAVRVLQPPSRSSAGWRSVPIVRSKASAWCFISPAVSSSARPAASNASACRRSVAPLSSSRSKTASTGATRPPASCLCSLCSRSMTSCTKRELALHRLQQTTRGLRAPSCRCRGEHGIHELPPLVKQFAAAEFRHWTSNLSVMMASQGDGTAYPRLPARLLRVQPSLPERSRG